MSDYYSTIANAVSALNRNTRDSRYQLYERARAALITQMREAIPALKQSDILAARISLEEAIGRVEADTQRERQCHQSGGARHHDNWLSELLACASRDTGQE
jgi:hypothetical protein